MQLDITLLTNFLDNVLAEDLGICADITTKALIGKEKLVNFNLVAKEDLVLSGIDIAKYYLEKNLVSGSIFLYKDAEFIKRGSKIISGVAKSYNLLTVERVILNFLQHMSGIATNTKNFVDKVSHTKTKICDTRKTIPGLRIIQKYAVKCGGGFNHRLTLDSAMMIKDNHIASLGSISEAIKLAKANAPHYSKIIVECDTYEQFIEATSNNADIVLLDNMSLQELRKCVEHNTSNAILEASGGVNLDNVKEIAETGVDYISVGSLTHSVKAVDIGLDIE